MHLVYSKQPLIEIVSAHSPYAIDPFEKCEVVCACILDGGCGHGSEIVLGSVNGSFCTRCYGDGIPSLCNHKQAVRAGIKDAVGSPSK